ncbi:MAG: IS21 family transposase, partial [Alphaproteobacteria bacterium]
FGRDRTIYDPWHYLPVLVTKPGALRADSDDRAQPFRHDGAQRSEMIAISGGHPVDMDLVSVS